MEDTYGDSLDLIFAYIGDRSRCIRHGGRDEYLYYTVYRAKVASVKNYVSILR